MKKISIYIIVIISCITNVYCGTWEVIDSLRYKVKEDGNYLYILYYRIISYNERQIIVAGNFGGYSPVIRYTYDKGRLWQTKRIDSLEIIRLNEIKYINQHSAIAVGESGNYWISRDGFQTWERKKIDIDYTIADVEMYDENFGMLTYKNGVYVTNNSCETWEQLDISLPIEHFPDIITEIEAVNKDTIFVLASKKYTEENQEYFIYTNDGGDSWYYTDTIPDIGVLGTCFIDSKHGWVCGVTTIKYPRYRDRICYTSDGGKTWESQLDTIAEMPKGLNGIFATDKNNLISWGKGGKLWKTTNGGKEWIQDTAFYNATIELDGMADMIMMPNGIIYGCSNLGGYTYRYTPDNLKIEDNNFELSYTLHPNPATSHITLSIGDEFISDPEIDIIDYLGNVIRWTPSARWSPSEKSITINTSSLSLGVYFLRIRNGDKVVVRKFVVI
jgi:photosystem II stability/assembly factor-like uncharacterized protein